MNRLYGGQRMVLQAIVDLQGGTSAFIDDDRIAEKTTIAIGNVRDWLLMLDQAECIDLVLTSGGMSASITPKGRLTLNLYAGIVEPHPVPAPDAPTPRPLIPPKGRTGRERAVVIGISAYPPPIRTLPGVANDVRAMAELLRSDQGQFPGQNVRSLVDGEATQQAVLELIEATFAEVKADDALFAYLAGHGAIKGGEYYFVAHDTTEETIAAKGVPLRRIKAAFDASPSQRAFLWLDFCHSGGILARNLQDEPDDRVVISRGLKVNQGQGKLIIAACTPAQSAWEQSSLGHGLFTAALLKGLKGEAAYQQEVTINSLYDYITKQMGSDRQTPMMFGEMTGRVVLTQTTAAGNSTAKQTPGARNGASSDRDTEHRPERGQDDATLTTPRSHRWRSLLGTRALKWAVPLILLAGLAAAYPLVPRIKGYFIDKTREPCKEVPTVADVGSINWHKVDLSFGKTPTGLEALKSQLHEIDGPLPPKLRQQLTENRELSGYSRPDVDRQVFHTKPMPREQLPLSIVIPRDLHVEIVAYTLLKDGTGFRLANKPDEFYQSGEQIRRPAEGVSEVDIVVFAFPLDECAYLYFRNHGFRLTTR